MSLAASDADLTAGALLKDWVLRLRLGNEINHDGWAEIMLAIDQLLPEEGQLMRVHDPDIYQ